MPVLAIIYGLYIAWRIIDGLGEHVKRKEAVWYMTLDLIATVVTLAAFVAYWRPGVFELLPGAGPYMFVASWAWLLAWSPYEVKRCVTGLKSDQEKRLYVRFGLWFETALALPALWFGGRAVLRAL